MREYKYTSEYLKELQALPLERKIQISTTRIIEWYQHFNGKVYVSFSGGKDSTVLLHLVRKIYPDVPAVFVDTGLEYPSIRDFVKTVDNVITLKQSKSFIEILNTCGYPVISKQVAQIIGDFQTGCPYTAKYFNGEMAGSRYNLQHYKYLTEAPFPISHKCCYYMKKKPFQQYGKETQCYAYIGLLAEESLSRQQSWKEHGCNVFGTKTTHSAPLSFWIEKDIINYLDITKIPYSPIYGDIVDGKLTGEQRTGCMFCMFGVHLEKHPNRFERMKQTHPQYYDYCINKLGCGKVLDYIGVTY